MRLAPPASRETHRSFRATSRDSGGGSSRLCGGELVDRFKCVTGDEVCLLLESCKGGVVRCSSCRILLFCNRPIVRNALLVHQNAARDFRFIRVRCFFFANNFLTESSRLSDSAHASTISCSSPSRRDERELVTCSTRRGLGCRGCAGTLGVFLE